MTNTSLVLLLIFALAGSAPAEDGFRPLFNGKDLTGWVVVNTAPSTWHFDEAGLLVCSGKPIGEIRTDRMYQNFVLELEWRHLVPKGNAGVFIWADDITARGQPFHRGIEVQVLENSYGNTQSHTTHGDIFPIHGATMTPVNGRGGGRAFPVENRSNPSPEWNHYRIECRDGSISLAVNGKVVTRGEQCSPRKGYICLESEGGVVNYRNVRIQELPETPIAPEHVAIANRAYRCLYSGVDFSGWKTADGADPGTAGWTVNDWILSAGKGAAALLSDESFEGDLGFIVDVKLGKDSGVPRISVRGALVEIDPAKLEPVGKWNRIEGSWIGDQFSLQVNGKPLEGAVDLSGLSERGPIQLISAGPVDWANIYVRRP